MVPRTLRLSSRKHAAYKPSHTSVQQRITGPTHVFLPKDVQKDIENIIMPRTRMLVILRYAPNT